MTELHGTELLGFALLSLITKENKHGGSKRFSLLLKIGATASGAAASDTYTTVGGLRSTSISMNQETVDVTNKDSANVRTMLADGGVKAFQYQGQVFLQTRPLRQLLELHLAELTFQTLR